MPSSPLTDPDVRISRFRFFTGELRSQQRTDAVRDSSVKKGAQVGVKATPLFDLASSAIRCRFVDRFARLKVLSHVARQRFSPRDAPLSSIGSRRDQFSDVISTMRALRLPTHASPVTYLFRFRGPRDSSSVRARRCQRSRADGGPATGQDPCSAGDPICRRTLTWT